MKDVLILGGGVIGLTMAHRLVKRGMSVAIVEASEQVGQGAGYANGALLTPSHSGPWNRPGVLFELLRSFVDPASTTKLRLAALPSISGWGMRFLRNSHPARHAEASRQMLEFALYSMQVFEEEYFGRIGQEFDFARAGLLKIFRSEQELNAATRDFDNLARHGLQMTRLDRSDAVAAEPTLSRIADQLAGALWFPNDALGDTWKFCQVIEQDLRRQGVEILTNTKVTGLLLEAGKVIGAKTANQDLLAQNTVLALGSKSVDLAHQVGVRLPVRPVKGYSVTFDGLSTDLMPRAAIADDRLHVGVIPIGDRLRVVGGVDFAGHNNLIDGRFIGNLMSVFSQVFPDIDKEQLADGRSEWSGFRPMSADGLPMIGACRYPGLWVNTGHGQLGWTLAAGAGEYMADLLSGVAPAIEARFSDPKRS
ncbi:FAD-dependent oxidoreductase [Thalassorhabdomicrobium marinisediminis]|uniref:FAD-dependent oxidoreductase n=1 Tax=Thalassorhabdomicrobium marinisediminis TaxID=2170577 RepID=UPI0024906026|nr:FAD-dependent oxidoreductase [Thalassorhabdomicrobium marinisediminis]